METATAKNKKRLVNFHRNAVVGVQITLMTFLEVGEVDLQWSLGVRCGVSLILVSNKIAARQPK